MIEPLVMRRLAAQVPIAVIESNTRRCHLCSQAETRMMSIVPPTKRDFTNSNYDKSQFEESAIMLPFGRASFLPAIVDRFQAVPIGMGANTDRQAYTIECLRRRLTLIFSGMGSPAAANALEHANANGVRRLILIGPCGGVDPDVHVGDIIIPTLAIRGEGTSRYYLPGEIPAKPDTELSSNLFDAVEHKQDFGIHRGTIYTTDASYRQGREVYENAEYQIVAVDSECAASFVVAGVLQMRMASILFCSDNVRLPDAAHRRRQGLENETIRRAFEAVVDCAIKVLFQTT